MSVEVSQMGNNECNVYFLVQQLTRKRPSLYCLEIGSDTICGLSLKYTLHGVHDTFFFNISDVASPKFVNAIMMLQLLFVS